MVWPSNLEEPAINVSRKVARECREVSSVWLLSTRMDPYILFRTHVDGKNS